MVEQMPSSGRAVRCWVATTQSIPRQLKVTTGLATLWVKEMCIWTVPIQWPVCIVSSLRGFKKCYISFKGHLPVLVWFISIEDFEYFTFKYEASFKMIQSSVLKVNATLSIALLLQKAYGQPTRDGWMLETSLGLLWNQLLGSGAKNGKNPSSV